MFTAKKLALERKRCGFERKKLASVRGQIYLEVATDYLKAGRHQEGKENRGGGTSAPLRAVLPRSAGSIGRPFGLDSGVGTDNERAGGARCARVITQTIAAASVERTAEQQSCQEK